jgi:paraquat-inducible protein A
MTASWAASHDLARCPTCEQLNRVPALPKGARTSCARCGGAIGLRKADSLHRSWALLIAAVVLYVPANLYPVMYVGRLGQSEGDTIFTGVQSMFAAGWWAVGTLIFTASIMVPLSKLIVLAYLLVSVGRASGWRPAERTRMYRIVEVVGHWSMLDVFVVSITVALVQLGVVAEVRAGIGATWFAAVVVLTMLSARSFDPRLIWDEAGQPEKSEDAK